MDELVALARRQGIHSGIYINHRRFAPYLPLKVHAENGRNGIPIAERVPPPPG